MPARVSVLINNYNYGRFLKDAVDSILNQTRRPEFLEIVVVDDGSTDESREVIRSYGARVKGVFQRRQGQTSAVNRGFVESSGDLIFLLDADDAWRPDKFEKILPVFDDPSIGAVEHLLQDADAALRPLPQRFPRWPARYGLADLTAGRAEFTAMSGLAFRRATLDKGLPLPAEMFFYLDHWMLSRALFFSDIANVPEPLGYHRVHGANWYAGHYENPDKIESDLRNRAIYRARLGEWLRERNLRMSEEAEAAERAETFRETILLEALRGRPREALGEWLAGLRGAPPTRRAAWRAATTLLAALSPTLYLRLYRLYEARA